MLPRGRIILDPIFRTRLASSRPVRPLALKYQSRGFGQQATRRPAEQRILPARKSSTTLHWPDQLNTTAVKRLSTMSDERFGREVLPDTVKPIHYDLSLHDLELGGAFTYQGTVSILAKIVRSTNEIVLHSHQLTIHSAEVTLEQAKSQQSFKSTGIKFDLEWRRATISFQEPLPAY